MFYILFKKFTEISEILLLLKNTLMPYFSSFAIQLFRKLSGILYKLKLLLNLISFIIFVQFGKKFSGISVNLLCEKSIILKELIFVRKLVGMVLI